ncbi:MAG TPA: adenylate/guanylate cyclase domain-containing protein [Alphaproteobacteria bacterium]|nr:adenylate/guanylate cyclase domain-containing protein [Alphaproteobacteria bacterium]
MSIRAKFFVLAGVLLLLFGALVGALSIEQAHTAHRLEAIVQHYQPLRALLADLDVLTDEYELRVDRLLRQPDRSPEELKDAASKIGQVGARIQAGFEKLSAELDAATAHEQDNPDQLEVLAQVQGALPLISRQVAPFIAVGKAVTDALVAGQSEKARNVALNFTKYEDAFGPDLAQMRHEVAALTEKATASIYASEHDAAVLSFILFVVAAALGLGISGFGSKQVVAALRKLLVSTRAIEAGNIDITVPVVTQDEVGELARAFNHMIAELRERERIKDTFGKFIDPRIVARLIAAGGADGLADQAERKVVTVFFSDIKDFSAIGEQLTSGATVKLLNAYFSAVTGEIRRHNGIVDKYIGDAVMAFWCAPFSPGDEHALDGCKAALAQIKAIADVRAQLADLTGLRQNAPDIVVRMGIATGEVVVGTIGSPNARSYTAIGDTVNLCSRLEGANKVYGTSIIMSEETYRLVRHAVDARELDVVLLAGKSEAIRIYELMGEAGGLDELGRELCAAFARGLDAYRRQDWDAAQNEFEACRRLAPQDGPSAAYIERVTHFRRRPPPADWDGVHRLGAK